MTHTVGPKGQVVIPKKMRDQLGLRPGRQVDFRLEDGVVHVSPHRPARLRGMFAGPAPFAELQRERDAELAHDEGRVRG